MYDPLVVSTFIAAFDEIAPAATRAGRLARSITVFDDRMAVQDRLTPSSCTAGTTRVILTEMRKSVMSADSFEVAIERALNYIKQTTPSRVCAIFEYRRDRDSFQCAQHLGDPSELLAGLVILNGDRVTGWVGANREMAINSDAILDLGPLAELFNPPLRRAISCPIEVAGHTAAVLTAYSDREEGFADRDVASLGEISEYIASWLKQRQGAEVLI